jgi:O-antigen/teichoic acid export membrane protein
MIGYMLQIGRNIFSLVLSRVLSGVILFLIYTRLVQYLGPDQAGQYGLLASYLTVFSFFVDIGMSQLVIKKISEDKTHTAKYLSNFFTIQVVLAILFMLIMDAFVFFADYPQALKNALYITGLGLVTSSLSLPFRAVTIAFQKLTVNAQINFLNALINAGMMALAIAFRQNIFFLAFISVAVGVFNILVYGILVHRKFTPFKFEIDRQFIKQLFIWTFPFTLLTLFSIYNRIDGLLLPHLRNFTENGYYSAAYKFWDVLAAIPGFIGITLYPFFAESMSREAVDDVKKGLEIYTRYMIALGIPMSVGTFMLSKELTLSFFGQDFLPAAPALWILVVAVSVLFIYTPANSLMIAKLTKTATKITGVNLVFNIAANLIFIPIFGFVAAAVVTLGSELIQMFGYSIAINKSIVKYNFFRYFIKPAIAGGTMAIVIYFMRGMNLWLVIVAAALAYGVVLILSKFFHSEDFVLFKAAVKLRAHKGEENT